jgi:hypothetical protein
MMVKPGQQYPLPNTVNITRQGVRVYKWRTRIIRGVGNFLEPLWSNTAEYKHLLKENTIKTGTKSRKDVMSPQEETQTNADYILPWSQSLKVQRKTVKNMKIQLLP